jgi:hypothetical protein
MRRPLPIPKIKRQLLMVAAALMLWYIAAGCVPTTAAIPRPANILNCDKPEGKRYICFSDKECSELFKGYSMIFKMRVEEHGETHPIIHMNIYADHTKLLLVGRIEGELRQHPTGGMKWYQKMWTIVCNEDRSIVTEQYSEGFRQEKEYDEFDPDKN